MISKLFCVKAAFTLLGITIGLNVADWVPFIIKLAFLFSAIAYAVAVFFLKLREIELRLKEVKAL